MPRAFLIKKYTRPRLYGHPCSPSYDEEDYQDMPYDLSKKSSQSPSPPPKAELVRDLSCSIEMPLDLARPLPLVKPRDQQHVSLPLKLKYLHNGQFNPAQAAVFNPARLSPSGSLTSPQSSPPPAYESKPVATCPPPIVPATIADLSFFNERLREALGASPSLAAAAVAAMAANSHHNAVHHSTPLHSVLLSPPSSVSSETTIKSHMNSWSSISPASRHHHHAHLTPLSQLNTKGRASRGSTGSDGSLSSTSSSKAENTRPSSNSSSASPSSNHHLKCKDCNKSYSTLNGLTKHQETHCIDRTFSCEFCDKVYNSLGAMKMHVRTHTLPCKCHICGKAFSRPWLLQGHIRTHTGEKPFSCTECGRSFADRSNLRAHLQTHSDVKKYHCQSCSKSFSRMSLLIKHRNSSCSSSGKATSLMSPMAIKNE